ncbi:hypothetical protein VTJ83DRAFT_871 [Remersonia thermophila]|uniref:NB-ARC domain-containing protein n=1 Tax=Remersonia thermophila TaxID=72144 RepID=A0ABR4DN03_9PEZI
MESNSFGSGNQGVEVVHNPGSINVNFHRQQIYPAPEPSRPRPRAFIPFSKDPDFINRGNILDRIAELFSESQTHTRVALVGLGGVGKSQLAIEYGRRIDAAQNKPDKHENLILQVLGKKKERHEKNLQWIFWIHAATRRRVEQGFRTIADILRLPGREDPKANIPRLVHAWLSDERNEKWIIILDSADDYDVFCAKQSDDDEPLASYLPQSHNGSILITTRSMELARQLTGSQKNIIEIGPMVQGEAHDLLKKKLDPLPDPETAEKLVKTLGFIPLAISQAAAYIQKRMPLYSAQQFLEDFPRRMDDLLQHDASDLRRDISASKAILTTWQITFDHIRATRRSAADCLSLISFFDTQGIPIWALKPSTTGDAPSTPAQALVDAFRDDVTMLRDYCLVSVKGTGDGAEFSMHPLVQFSTHRWLKTSGRYETFHQQFVERMAATFPTPDYESWTTCQSLFPHIQAALNYKPRGDTVEAWGRLLRRAGNSMYRQRRHELAHQILTKAREAQQELLGPEHDATLYTTLTIVKVLIQDGKVNEAKELNEKVLNSLKSKQHGLDNPSMLMAIHFLAEICRRLRRFNEAEELLRQVLKIRQEKLGPDHHATLESMNDLANMYRKQNQLNEAEELQKQVLKSRQERLEPDHPYKLMSMKDLALTYIDQRRLKKAEDLLQQVVQISKEKLGAEHPETLLSLNSLAATYWMQNRLNEAEGLQKQVLKIYQETLGPDHPDTLMTMRNLARTWWDQGRSSDAIALLNDFILSLQRVFSADHPDVLMASSVLAGWRSERSGGRENQDLASG